MFTIKSISVLLSLLVFYYLDVYTTISLCLLVSLCVYYYVYVYITISMCILPSIVTIATARSNLFYEPKAGKGQRVDMSIYANNVFYLSQTPLTSLALTYSQRANCVERSQSNKSNKNSSPQ